MVEEEEEEEKKKEEAGWTEVEPEVSNGGEETLLETL